MTDYYIPEPPAEKAFLVGVSVHGSKPLFNIDESLRELTLLAKTAGMEVVGSARQTVHQINSATFIGSGKVEEIIAALPDVDAEVVIFDDELSPRHQRELEKRFGNEIKVLDRSALILDIFAQHAQTREGAFQVELAQYEYRLPRLTRQWTHLARQAGGSGSRSGVGLRGPGETQLEVDRREIGRRISKLKSEIERIRQHRGQFRSKRVQSGIPVVALVGYTNAGKSTLLNALTDAKIYTADQLFATLDPTTRRMTLPSGRQVLLTDTVGFIQKLPTTLVAAFRATLEEITEADLLLHVVDTPNPNVIQHIETVEDTLAEIDTPRIPRILVWNKNDLCPEGHARSLSEEMEDYRAEVDISAMNRAGLDDLVAAIDNTLAEALPQVKLLIPHVRGDLVSMLYEQANVINQENGQDGAILTVQLPEKLQQRFEAFRVTE
jgi:GTP-binding protein HflX